MEPIKLASVPPPERPATSESVARLLTMVHHYLVVKFPGVLTMMVVNQK